MKIITDVHIHSDTNFLEEINKIIKVHKKFNYKNIELRLVTRKETYLNSVSSIEIKRIVNKNNNIIPISFQHKDTQKAMIEKTINWLDNMYKRFDNEQSFINELSK